MLLSDLCADQTVHGNDFWQANFDEEPIPCLSPLKAFVRHEELTRHKL